MVGSHQKKTTLRFQPSMGKNCDHQETTAQKSTIEGEGKGEPLYNVNRCVS